MAHIKVYQRVDPRFNVNKKQVKQIKKINNEMKLILENWNLYVEQEQLDEDLQSTIKAAAAKLINGLKEKIEAIRGQAAEMEESELDTFLGSKMFEPVRGKIQQAETELKALSSSELNESKNVKIITEDFDEFLRKDKHQIQEVFLAAAATATHNPILTLAAAFPFILIKLGQLLNFLGYENAAKKFIHVGEVIEIVQNTTFGTIAMAGSGFRIANFCINKSRNGSTFFQNWSLPSVSKEYWMNPENPLITEEEVGVESFSALGKKIAKDVGKDLHHAHEEGEMMNKVDSKVLDVLISADKRDRMGLVGAIFNRGEDETNEAFKEVFKYVAIHSEPAGYGFDLNGDFGQFTPSMFNYQDALLTGLIDAPLKRKKEVFDLLRTGKPVTVTEEEFKKAEANNKQVKERWNGLKLNHPRELNKNIQTIKKTISRSRVVRKAMKDLEKKIANTRGYKNAASKMHKHVGAEGEREKAIKSWQEKFTFIAQLILALIVIIKLLFHGGVALFEKLGNLIVRKAQAAPAADQVEKIARAVEKTHDNVSNLEKLISASHDAEATEQGLKAVAKVAGKAGEAAAEAAS